MQCNQAGRALIESFEHFEPVAYHDQNGILTIGYGHIAGVYAGQTCTQAEADAWMESDLAWAEACVNDMVTVTLIENQYSALCCFVFNIGSGHFKGSSALHLLNTGDLADVPAHMQLWNEAGGAVSNGLVRRRQAEVDLWNTP